MKVQGMVDPGSFTVERIPGSGRSLVRLFQNVTPVQTEDFTGYEYDEYHVEVETWDGIAANVRENYDIFLRKGIHDVKTVLNSVESHYSEDNIAKRDAWMKWVNDRAVVYDQSIEVLKEEMDKNTEITMSLYIESKRSSIISFASYCVCPDNPVTREQFKRVFRIYAEYEEIIKDNDLQNGEVDIAIRIIREAYENHLRNGSFVEDVRGY